MKYVFLMIMMLGMFGPGLAQDPPPRLSPERMKEIRAQKSAYLTARLSLTPEEAQRFWPVYNMYDEKTHALRRELHEMDQRTGNEDGGPSESDANAFMAKELENRQLELDLLREFQEDSKRMIGAVRTVELGRAERDFHREVLKRYRSGSKDREPGRK